MVKAYSGYAPSERKCREWFQRFKNGDFSIENKERPGTPKKFAGEELKALLDEYSTQTLENLAKTLGEIVKRLHNLGMIQKLSPWVPHELSEGEIATRQVICDIFL